MAEVWIVDDEPDIVELLQYNLMRAGYSVTAFQEAAPALEALKAQKPDLILCDWMMPGMDGLDFCRLLRNSDLEGANVPFVMVSCRSDRDSVSTARATGVNGYVVKPFRMTDLIRKIESLIR